MRALHARAADRHLVQLSHRCSAAQSTLLTVPLTLTKMMALCVLHACIVNCVFVQVQFASCVCGTVMQYVKSIHHSTPVGTCHADLVLGLVDTPPHKRAAQRMDWLFTMFTCPHRALTGQLGTWNLEIRASPRTCVEVPQPVSSSRGVTSQCAVTCLLLLPS